MSRRPRFIAGAVCPRCGVLDRIVMSETEDGQRRQCVDCGFVEDLAQDGAAPDLPGGRLDGPRTPKTAAQPVRFYPRRPKGG